MFDEYERIQTHIQRIPDPSGYTSETKGSRSTCKKRNRERIGITDVITIL